GHSSHYSSAGGSVAVPLLSPPPAPVVRKPPVTPKPAAPPSSTLTSPFYATPAAPTASTPSAPRATQDEISEFVRKVQIALLLKGYDPGLIDGTLGETTRAALSKFQVDHRLSVTGYMSVET